MVAKGLDLPAVTLVGVEVEPLMEGGEVIESGGADAYGHRKLGGIGAILAVPLTMIIMAILNNFENTKWIATLMSTPKSDKEDNQEAAKDKLQEFWQKTKHTIKGTADKDDENEA